MDLDFHLGGEEEGDGEVEQILRVTFSFVSSTSDGRTHQNVQVRRQDERETGCNVTRSHARIPDGRGIQLGGVNGHNCVTSTNGEFSCGSVDGRIGRQ